MFSKKAPETGRQKIKCAGSDSMGLVHFCSGLH